MSVVLVLLLWLINSNSKLRKKIGKLGLGYRKGWSGGFASLISSIFIRGYYLQYINFLSLGGKESVIRSVYPCPWFGKAGEN